MKRGTNESDAGLLHSPPEANASVWLHARHVWRSERREGYRRKGNAASGKIAFAARDFAGCNCRYLWYPKWNNRCMSYLSVITKRTSSLPRARESEIFFESRMREMRSSGFDENTMEVIPCAGL